MRTEILNKDIIMQTTDADRITTAKRFLSFHKQSDPDHWEPREMTGNTKLLSIYYRLMINSYGPIRLTNIEINQHGAYVFNGDNDLNEFEIEIPARLSKNGMPVLFTWTDTGGFENG